MAVARGVRYTLRMVNLHFRVREGTGSELEFKLRKLGFENIRTIGESRVLLWATEKQLAERLGLVTEHEQREVREGLRITQAKQHMVSNTNGLPQDVAELVLSLYVPPVPNRTKRS